MKDVNCVGYLVGACAAQLLRNKRLRNPYSKADDKLAIAAAGGLVAFFFAPKLAAGFTIGAAERGYQDARPAMTPAERQAGDALVDFIKRYSIKNC